MSVPPVRATRSAPAAHEVADLGEGRGPLWLDAFLAVRMPEILTWRRHLHAHPEISHAEFATTAYLRRQLGRSGLDSAILPGGTGLVCDVGPSGPGVRTVALRADIDALPLPEASGLPFASTVPGVSHACGHDVHQTVLLGALLALNSAPELPGRIRGIFQPAEETQPGGAFGVAASGAVDDVERIFALHCDPRLPVGEVGIRVGPITSTIDLIELAVTGSGGHTARPHLTADLVYALGTVITGLPGLLSRRMDPRSAPILVWGAVRAGEAANAIPRSGLLRGTLRIMRRDAWDTAEDLVRQLVADLLAPLAVDHQLTYLRGVPPVVNDERSAELMSGGITDALGSAGLTTTHQSTGAEDFAVYLDHVPGALGRLGVWDGARDQVDLHSPHFEADERAIAVGIRTIVNTALRTLQGPAPD
ncbi:MAG: amidohydrolase [Nakamurella sp.]